MVRDRGSLGEALCRISANVLSIGISSDQLFPVHEQKLLAHIVQGYYSEIDSSYGHDGFLIEVDQVSEAVYQTG